MSPAAGSPERKLNSVELNKHRFAQRMMKFSVTQRPLLLQTDNSLRYKKFECLRNRITFVCFAKRLKRVWFPIDSRLIVSADMTIGSTAEFSTVHNSLFRCAWQQTKHLYLIYGMPSLSNHSLPGQSPYELTTSELFQKNVSLSYCLLQWFPLLWNQFIVNDIILVLH